MKNIIITVGARPNFMKVAPLLRILDGNSSFDVTLIHTGQHYDHKMSDVFFEELNIRKPDYNFNIGSGSHSMQTAKIMLEFEKICNKKSPDLLIVVGDVNSTMACSIVAKKLHVEVAHIEAGLRSYDRNMPEEINRLITDSISDYFFVTEKSAVDNLLKEGIDESKIHFVGNLMIDSLHYGLNQLSKDQKFQNMEYGLVTLHRPANVDNIIVLKELMAALSEISQGLKLLFPIHPRTRKIISENEINFENIELMDPLPYLTFLHAMRDSKVIFTDSGGIQEESTVLKIPCYTLRENTERPITINQGTNILAGVNKNKILQIFKKNKFNINSNYKLPEKWDGKSSQRIAKIIERI